MSPLPPLALAASTEVDSEDVLRECHRLNFSPDIPVAGTSAAELSRLGAWLPRVDYRAQESARHFQAVLSEQSRPGRHAVGGMLAAREAETQRAAKSVGGRTGRDHNGPWLTGDVPIVSASSPPVPITLRCSPAGAWGELDRRAGEEEAPRPPS